MSMDVKSDSSTAISTSTAPLVPPQIAELSTPDRDVLSSPSRDEESAKGEPAQLLGSGKKQFELTDQTNLLPAHKLIPVFVGLMATILVSILDSSIVSTAIPTISAKFNSGKPQ